jgi:hypothetical protein
MPAAPQPATIRDISHDGCRIEVPRGTIELGGTAVIEVPGVGSVAGSIVWTQGRVAGVRFERSLASPAAIAFGLEQPKPVEVLPDPVPRDESGGILTHWFRRLSGIFS